ncbi:hypothetical protein DRJ16_05740 [Candidatus Woesearchaeota archaeon]|nr:MAG: hypothetical protein DRJ16_05740 [Candidatus Woesearchaeota archaeon]
MLCYKQALEMDEKNKKIIAFDLDGTLILSGASERAHYDFFKVMSVLLDDESIESLAGKEEWMGDVIQIMSEYTGLNPKNKHSKKAIIKMARNIYQLLYLKAMHENKDDLYLPEIAIVLKTLKKEGFVLTIVTTMPETIVKPILETFGIINLIDIIETQSLDESPDKKELLEDFCNKHGKPAAYIGNSREDSEACNHLGIRFILAGWDISKEEADDIESDATVFNPEELINIVKSLQD